MDDYPDLLYCEQQYTRIKYMVYHHTKMMLEWVKSKAGTCQEQSLHDTAESGRDISTPESLISVPQERSLGYHDITTHFLLLAFSMNESMIDDRR